METKLIPMIHDEKLLSEMQKAGLTKRFSVGSMILDDGDMINYVPIVISGSIRVTRTDEDGKEILLYYIKPGESCVMSFFGSLHHQSSQIRAVIEEEAELLLIPREYVSEWIKKFPSWLDYILQLYNRRFEELLSTINSIAFQKIDFRVMEFLNAKVKLTGKNEINITHQQIANELGTAREVVSRLLKQLERDGKVRLSRNKIEVLK